jgi:hypothetical protein
MVRIFAVVGGGGGGGDGGEPRWLEGPGVDCWQEHAAPLSRLFRGYLNLSASNNPVEANG